MTQHNTTETETDRIYAGEYYIIADLPHIVKGAGERTVEPNTRVMCMEDAPADSWDVIDIELSDGGTNQVYAFELLELSEFTDEHLKMIALAEYLDIDFDDILNASYDSNVFEIDGDEYLVCTDEEADDRAADDITETLWAFNPGFIIDHSKLPYEATDMIIGFCTAKCEDANATIAALIDDMEELIEDAISSDGRGRFLNHYDGEEYTSQGFYIYQV